MLDEKYPVVGLDGQPREVLNDGYDYVDPNNSAASQACARLSQEAHMNLRLASKRDYLQLVGWFDHLEDIIDDPDGEPKIVKSYFSPLGAQDLSEVFPDMKDKYTNPKWFWSSSIYPFKSGYNDPEDDQPYSSNSTYVFDGTGVTSMERYDSSISNPHYKLFSVRCVGKTASQ